MIAFFCVMQRFFFYTAFFCVIQHFSVFRKRFSVFMQCFSVLNSIFVYRQHISVFRLCFSVFRHHLCFAHNIEYSERQTGGIANAYFVLPHFTVMCCALHQTYLDQDNSTHSGRFISRHGPSTVTKIKEAINFMRNQHLEVCACEHIDNRAVDSLADRVLSFCCVLGGISYWAVGVDGFEDCRLWRLSAMLH